MRRTSPGWVWFWVAVWKFGWLLIELGLELEPLNGVQHPWLDTIAGGLQWLGGQLRRLAKASLSLH